MESLSNSASPSSEPPDETELQAGQVRSRSECSSSNQKRARSRSDRKELLDEIGFIRGGDNDLAVRQTDMIASRVSGEDKKWHQHYERLVEFKRKKGHCIVPTEYKEDKSLGYWVSKQRAFHSTNKLRQDRKELLDELGFVWKVYNLAARSSTKDDIVRGLVIGSFHDLVI